ncbi:RHS repeat-associated core domain-containing protein, partial [Streptomyces diastatochromogenes]|uniref:RHS repeat-associated core domain-containing protein n=1 Tax=Streptomyces diastatochromogenes TaxID=42236 RepID=UPI003685CAEC
DADGNQLIRRDPAQTTLFAGDTEIIVNTAVTPNVLLGALRTYTHGGGTGQPVAVRSSLSGGGLKYLFTDAHGTATLAMDATTQQVARQQYTPYGQQRSSANTTAWPDPTRSYLGKPQDTSTGYTDVGARKYDPTLGQFISADPVFEANSPQELGGYTYAADNPVAGSDPSGLRLACGPEYGEAACPKNCPNGNCRPVPTQSDNSGDSGNSGGSWGGTATSVVVNGTVSGVAAGTNLIKMLTNTERNAAWLRGWAKSQGWMKKPNSPVEKWGYVDADGKFVWMLQLKFQASTTPGLQAGSQQPRISSRLDLKGKYTNPFTGQTGGKGDALLGSNDPSANLSHIPLEEQWVKPGSIDLMKSGVRVAGKLMTAVAVGYDVYDVASAPSDQRVSVATRDAAGLAGGLAGAAYGAEVGASIGSAVPGLGTAAGGIVGGLVGGIIGSGVGESIVNGLEDLF